MGQKFLKEFAENEWKLFLADTIIYMRDGEIQTKFDV